MIGLLGASGYIGGYFAEELNKRGIPWIPLGRDYNPNWVKLSVLINCAGYTGKPNVDACETNKKECYEGNVLLPKFLAEKVSCPILHVSSGCIFEGDGPFDEQSEPNFTGSYYSQTKAWGEAEILKKSDVWIARLRIPFDKRKSPRNYLTKLLSYDRLISVNNSLSYVPDFVNACLALIEQSADYGIYNVTNPNAISAKQICEELKFARLKDSFIFQGLHEFQSECAAKRSNCVLNSDKIQKYYQMTPVEEAIKKSIQNYG
jgi:dTDP-4-dehydrorhamnose reductase